MPLTVPSFYNYVSRQPTPQNQYNYRPLTEREDIRLLKVSVPWYGPSKFAIIHTPLSKAPKFQTVSYHWGSSTHRHTLALEDGKTLPITDSLARAIPKLSKLCTTGYLWIDQICIDQNNIPERNQQVKVMSEIYKAGCEVLIWLDCHVDLKWPTKLLLAAAATSASIGKLQELTQHPAIRDDTAKIFNCAWFRRAWVLQEYVLSSKASFVVGGRLLDAKALFNASRALFYTGGAEILRSHPGISNFSLMVRIRSESSNPFYIVLHSIHRMADFESSDPRDLVYAFLGFQQDKNIKIEPNYHLKFDEVLIDVAATIIRDTASLHILGIQAPNLSFDDSSSRLPSWVPDWAGSSLARQTIDWHEGHELPIHFRAAQGRPHTSTSDGPRLTVRGKVIDKVLFRPDPKFPSQATTMESTNILETLDIDSRVSKLASATNIPVTMERFLRVVMTDGSHRYQSILHMRNPAHQVEWDNIKQFVDQYYRFDPARLPIPYPPRSLSDAYILALQYCAKSASRRHVFQSSSGKLGLATKVETGHLIAILHGCTTPVLLRPHSAGTYLFVATCYFEDAMFGEAVTWADQDADEFVLD